MLRGEGRASTLFLGSGALPASAAPSWQWSPGAGQQDAAINNPPSTEVQRRATRLVDGMGSSSLEEFFSELSFGPFIFLSSLGLKKQFVLDTCKVRKQALPPEFRRGPEVFVGQTGLCCLGHLFA